MKLIYSPLRINDFTLILGIVLWLTGLVGLIMALYHYQASKKGSPATAGLYRYSRNPQAISIWIIFLGICFCIGSGISLLLFSVSLFFFHFSTLAEEASCLKQYGRRYQRYMEKVPRYFFKVYHKKLV